MSDGIRFVNGWKFLENLLAFRLLHIEGHLGSGKTLLGVALARWLWKEGHVQGCFSNIPIDENFVPRLDTCINAAVLLDEGASFADARLSKNKYEGYGVYARKLNCFMIVPSKNNPDRRMRDLRCEREADFWMINAWLYRWKDNSNQKGRFLFFGYEEVFDAYPHNWIPADDAGIREVLFREIDALSGSNRRIYVAGRVPKVASPYSHALRGGGNGR